MKYLLSFLILAAISCDAKPKNTSTSSAPSVVSTPALKSGPISQTNKFRSDFKKGISLGLFVSKKDDPVYEFSIYKKMLKEIADTGATHLSIPVRWIQKDVYQSEIFPSPETTVSDTMLISVMKEARTLGLKVFLMPFIHLKMRGNGMWRGTLEPKEREKWWLQYRKFIYHYANIAAENNVSMFSIGSELSSMRDPNEWEEIITETRKRLPKTQLTYSANWDRFETFSHWDKLDVIGISTYPPLSQIKNPTLKQVNAGWGQFKHRIRNLMRRVPAKRIIFTEAGYSASMNAAKTPWAHAKKGDEVDEELQALLYHSLLQTWSRPKYLDGMFIWNWFGPGGPDDNGFSPRGKKAETLLKDWY